MELSRSLEVPDAQTAEPEKMIDVFASHVYVLMKKKTRVSRNLRACWFFRHLCRSVHFTPLTTLENLAEDLNLVSVIAQDPDQKLEHGHTYNVHIGPDTVVTFLSWQYRLAFSLDLSPSLMSVDVENGQYVYDGIFQSLSRCLRGLVMPYPIPGSDVWFSPDLYISVIIQTPIVCSTTNQVLIQGVKVNQENLNHYLDHIKYELDQFEVSLSLSFASMLSHHPNKDHPTRPGEVGEGERTQLNSGNNIGSPEAAFTNIIRYGILSLQLLPNNSSSGIVVITDGIIGLPSSYMIELLLEQLRNHTIMCSFIKVGSPSGLYRQLGRVPHIEMMQTIATATFGAVLSSAMDVSDKRGEANQYHRAMLFWAFQKGLEGFKYELTYHSDEDMPGSISWIRKMLHRHPITGESFGTELISRERDKRKVRASLANILSVRLREGYTIKSISFPKDKKEIHVKLQFPWRHYGRIEYAATAPWPLEYPENHTTEVQVSVEGSYDLLHELLCKNSDEHKSPYKVNNIKTLWTIIEKISATDMVLAHLQSFSSEPFCYQVPEGIRSGVPLFYMQQDGPSLNMQLKQSNVMKFAAFWKEVVQLDTNNWQKWLHSHRIGLIMEHDRQLPKYFQVPNPSSRFTSIQCRQALASLSLMLREWSTFVLAEDHSYIKLLYKGSEKTPRFFCVLRLTHILPTMIIRLGFLGGTPGHIRTTELENLQERIRTLHFPQRGSQKPTKKMVEKNGSNAEELPPHKCPLNREGSEILSCVLMTKPVEKIFINYECKPCDMTKVLEPGKEEGCGRHCQPQQQSAMWSMFRTITHYLQHQRWVWDIQAGPKVTISMAAISRILATITKLRLQEGFNVLSSGAGVTNLVVEVDMKENAAASDEGGNIQTCVVQYVIFPPHIKTACSNSSEDVRGDGEMRENEEEIQLVTECWVEPQYGVCCHNPPERKHFEGLTYENITRAFYPYDHEIVSSLSTFEHVVYLCENPAIPSHDVVSSRQSSPPSTPGHHRFVPKKEESIRSEPTVNFISFPFDLLSILPRSQQGELLFSSFVIGDESGEGNDMAMEPNEVLFSLFYDRLKEAHDNEIMVSSDDCHRFMYHILQRQRDHHSNPVPFAYQPDSCCNRDFQFQTSLESDSPFFKQTSGKSEFCSCPKTSTAKLSPDTKGSCNSASTGTYVTAPGCKSESPLSSYLNHHHHPHQPDCRYSRYSRSSSDSVKPSRKSDSSNCPLWKCYVKLENPDHLLMTFVPSSFEDLLLLNPVKVGTATTAAESASCGDRGDNKSGLDITPDNTTKSADVSVVNAEGSPSQDLKLDSPGVDKSVSVSTNTDKATTTTTRPLDLSLSMPDQTGTAGDQTRDSFLSPTQSSNEKVHEWMITHTPAVKPKVRGALLIPVYMYSCQLKNITNSLTDRWSFSLPEDLFEDMSFKPEFSTSHSTARMFMQPPSSPADKDRGGTGRHSADRRSTDSFSFRLETFKEHGQNLSELFLSSYVTGVYQSLQNDHSMSSQDVDAAINNICEESHLLEMDMTTYLTASCSHFQHLVQRARIKGKVAEETNKRGHMTRKEEEEEDVGGPYHRQPSIRFDDDVDISSFRDEEHSCVPEILQLPSIAIDLANEDGDPMSPHQCRNVKEQSGQTENVQGRFETVIGKNFRAIQSLPDFFFYCPSVQIATGELDATDKLEDTEFSMDDPAVETAGDEDEDIVMTTSVPGGEEFGNTSMASNPDQSSLDSSFDSSNSTNHCVDLDKGPVPLFVHLTCTVRERSNSQHVSVRTVPLCFGEIVRQLTEQLEFIDFRDFKVTLDITCLTLVGEDEEDHVASPRKRLLSRCISVTSQHSGVEEDIEDISTVNSIPLHQRMGDHVRHLSKEQNTAIQELKEGIEWLLQEEIISALRRMSPISADTLAYVSEHIKTPSDMSSDVLPQTCLSEGVSLQFVHGPEQSHRIFIEEFERQNLGEYRLTKEGDFYFVILNKVHTRHLHYIRQLRPTSAHHHHHHKPSNRRDSQIESDSHNHADDDDHPIDREERSLSLPCVLSEQTSIGVDNNQTLPLTSRSLTQSRTDGEGMELGSSDLGGGSRRRCSDEKSIKSAKSDEPFTVGVSFSNEDGGDTKEEADEHVGGLVIRTNSPVRLPDKSGDNSLKKSSSFAGLQGAQVRSPSPGLFVSRHRHRSAPSGPSNTTGQQTVMMRNAGFVTPYSPSILSSRASTTTDDGEGFEGDVSDNEMDEMTSMSDISMDSPELPPFWLLIKILNDSVLLYFHSKAPIDEEGPTCEEQKKLYLLMKDNALQVCTKVNQTLLLRDLYKTKVCNTLLVPEADEDFNWPNQRTRTVSYGYGQYEDDDTEESSNPGYLYASMDPKLSPGLFACPVMWRQLFPLHPRLKMGRQRREPTLGLLALQSVLEKFSVANRRNMFVMEDTTTRNVFYVRLKELQINQENTDIDLDTSLSDSTYLSLSRNEIPVQADSDTVSLTSNMSRQTSRVDDLIELTMYGVEEPGKDFIDGLRQVLLKRMDEKLLDAVTVPLSRNPQCKLMPEDIYFIQRPYQEPVKTLRLTIPSHCSMYLVSLMYYLRQNLLLFLHTPHYVDNNNRAGHFQDKYEGIWKSIPSHKVFLYNRPAVGGGKGLACISLNLVDGQGQPVKLLNCPSPARYNAPVVNVNTRQEFENLVSTNVHEPPASARAGPGPTALIQFKIWVCGRCDIPSLCDKLQSSVRHATCDIIMEYYMLTYPICWVPNNLLDVSAPPVSSLPSSPTKLPDEEEEEVMDRGVNPLNRKFSVEPPKSVTHEKNFFLRFERLTNSKSSSAGKCLDFSNAPPEHSPTPHGPTSRQSSSGVGIGAALGSHLGDPQEVMSSDRQKVAKYEEGETGSLHPVFCSTMEPWMTFCHSTGVPSMTKVSFQFQSRFCMDFVMKELLQSIPTISTDTTLRVFKVLQNPVGDPQGILFTPCKRAAKDNSKALIQKFSAAGLNLNMLAIGRDLEQWQAMVQTDPDVQPCISTSTLRVYCKGQRFLPQVVDEVEGQKDTTSHSSHSRNLGEQTADSKKVEKHFVPRQKLLLILCEKKELTLLLYNWNTDMSSKVEKIVGRLIQWNNARSHILDSIVAQKMGLFHHMTFSDLNHSMKQNPYTQSVGEVESLIRHHAPSKDYQRRHSSLSHKEKDKAYPHPHPHPRKHMVPFDQTYKNLCPPKSLDRLLCSLSSDPVVRHGIQTQEIRLNSRQDKSQSVRKDVTDEKVSVSGIGDQVFQHGFQLLDTQKLCVKEEERSTLRMLYYVGWSQQGTSEGHSNHPAMEEYLTQLKRTGRLFHYCATPMVFCAKWRHNVVQKTVGKMADPRNQTTEMSALSVLSLNSAGTTTANNTNTTTATVINSSQATTPATPDKAHKTRSRHSSGTSIISAKGGKSGDTADSSRKGSVSEPVSGGGSQVKGQCHGRLEKEESWHLDLRRRFIQEYTDYLVTELDFILFNVKPSVVKRSAGNSLPNQTPDNVSDLTFNLQKTLAGGIILMELSFRQEYFCVNMYSIDCSQLQVVVRQEEQHNFVNECDAYKDLIHVHSFAHDFHLRCVQSYLAKESSTFPSGFDLDCFLSDFKQVYPYPPSFSRNCILEDALCLQDLPFPGHMLYEYMLKHMGLQDMTMIRMADKFALVRLQLLDIPLQPNKDDNQHKQLPPFTIVDATGNHGNKNDEKESEPYHASLVIINNSKSSEQDHMTLNLKFFTVLTRQRNCHPRLQLEKVFSDTIGEESCPNAKKPIDVMKTNREHYINYRGYSNRCQIALHKVLNYLSDQGRCKIEEMVEMSKMKCRRDYLWNRLLTNPLVEETKKRHSDTEDKDSSPLNPLKYSEFCELLTEVTITPLNKADPRLSPLFGMPMSWYRLLVSVLMTKYRDDHRIRIFESEGRKRYIVILNSNNLNMFAMLGLQESTQQLELCMVMKEPLADVSQHSPETPNLALYSLQTHLEDFVNVCCYHMWASMI